MNFTEAIKSVLWTNYKNFSGRARRSEYWYYVLFSILASVVLTLITAFIPQLGLLTGLFSLYIIIPNYAVTVRRLHDVGKSGKLILISIALAVLAIGFILAGMGSEAFSDHPNLTNANTTLVGVGGLFYLVDLIYGLYLLYLSIKDSDYGDNKYGPNPKGLDGTSNF